MNTTTWPFDTDADEHDPLTALRIPVVGSFNPRWSYIAAYLKPQSDHSYTFGSADRPTDSEAKMIASYIEEYIQHWFNERYQRKLAERPLDVDGGCNTTVFIKYGPGDWAYRRCSWQYGPLFVPEPPSFADRTVGPLTLLQVMDRNHTIADEPLQHWVDWKAAHPEVFGS
ncbi:hypothetical protein GT352_27945 [Streptomyces sp. SID1046]|uniref:hypothetical protein n=1 Tax=Streptomyces sp. SID1046 TaxID=2690249 RepID=UPI00136E62D8|nr:hypothetical protein [Streptomyces sp. SID1046]MYV77733.1 hypothetical protein [Streptomyces sp. SID1046]